MIKLITTKRLKLLEADLAYATAEVARLKKIRPIAEALISRGISADDLLSGRIHLRHNPKRRAA